MYEITLFENLLFSLIYLLKHFQFLILSKNKMYSIPLVNLYVTSSTVRRTHKITFAKCYRLIENQTFNL